MPLEGNSLTISVTQPISRSEDWNVGSQITNIGAEADAPDTPAKMEEEGAMGLILAVPLVAVTKIICDYIDSMRGFAAWLGD